MNCVLQRVVCEVEAADDVGSILNSLGAAREPDVVTWKYEFLLV